METSRDLRAALTWWRGAHAYSRLALAAMRRAGLEPLTDPRVIAQALGYTVVPIMSFDDRWRADLRGSTIHARWHPDHAEDRLNVYFGLSLAVLRDAGESPTPTQAWSMTLALALPDNAPELWEGHPHVPGWLVDLHVAARRDDRAGMRSVPLESGKKTAAPNG